MEMPSKITIGFFLILIVVTSGLILLSMGFNDDKKQSDDDSIAPEPTEPEKVHEPITKQSVIFDDGLSSVFEQRYSYFYRTAGEKAPFIEPDSKERHVFMGWKYDGQLWNFNNPVETDMILVVDWSEHFTVSKDVSTMVATVSMCDDWKGWNNIIDWNDGSTSSITADIESISHTYNDNINEITVISYSGSEMHTSSCPVYFNAGHVPMLRQFEVRFFDEGNQYTTVEVSYGKKVFSPQMPVENGKQFLGWYSGGKEWDFNEPVVCDMNLVAKWEIDESLEKQIIKPVVNITTVTGGTFLNASETENAAHFEWYINRKLVAVSDTMILSPELPNWSEYGNTIILKVYSESRSVATWEQYFPA